MADIAEEITGQRPTRPTNWRWIRKGVNGGVKLAAVPFGGTWCTTAAAFRDFLRRRGESSLQPKDTAPTDDDLKSAGLL